MKKYILFLLLLSAMQVWGNGNERILNFHSDIRIDTTGRIEITENITVYAKGVDIRRGIIRTIPLYRVDKEGKKQKASFRILSIQRDGNDERYSTETAGDNLDVYIGSGDTYLEPGTYKYTITYESYGQVGFFDTYDELYWNATGNDWAFTIDKASATMILPDSISFVESACYTGTYGSSQSNCTAELKGNIVSFRANKKLSAGEGLTVVASFPRNIIKRPPPPTWAESMWDKHKQPILVVFSILLMSIYYFFTWLKVGKDPEKPVAIPTFKAPHGWSPAVVRYLYKREYENKAFTITLVSMAVKGAIRILHDKKKYTLEKTGSTDKLSSEEKTLYDALFISGKSISVANKNHTTFSSANTKLQNAINIYWDIKDYYLKNIGYIVVATILAVILFIAYVALVSPRISFDILLYSSPVGLVGLVLIFSAIRQKGWINRIILIVGIILAFPLVVQQIVFLYSYDPLTVIFTLFIFISFGLYVYLIKAPTELGAQTTADLKGFRMYLKTAEENRLNLLTPPDKTPELYEELLPYAIALDVENEWGKKFDNVLQQANYQPDWYTSNKAFTYNTFGNSFTRSLGSSVHYARMDPSSSSSGSSGSGGWSSGSSGGGFSGGGGGGGGGRGW